MAGSSGYPRQVIIAEVVAVRGEAVLREFALDGRGLWSFFATSLRVSAWRVFR